MYIMPWTGLMGNEEIIKPKINKAISAAELSPDIKNGVDLYNSIIAKNSEIKRLTDDNFSLSAWMLGRCEFAFGLKIKEGCDVNWLQKPTANAISRSG